MAPAERIVCLSTSHVGFLRELGLQERIVSYERTLDVERIVSLRPDLVMVSWAADGERLAEMGLRCEVIGEWLETTPLERAGWIVRVAELCGVREKGVERLEQIAKAYEAERLRARRIVAERGGSTTSGDASRPRVMLNAPYGGVWFVPSDDNYMVRLIEDAGGRWIFKGANQGRESYPVDVEAAWLAMSGADGRGGADVWLNVNEYTSLAALLADNRRFADTPPVLSGRVFNNIARPTSDGSGSDFWESGVVRPDLVLHDLVNILHPVADTLYYYMRLQ